MAPDVQSSNGHIGVLRGMGSNRELKRSSQVQQSLSKGKEKVLPPRGFETIKYPDKLKEDNYQSLAQTQKLRDRQHCIQGKATADDELVKHMSNLPRYLQRMERGENLQGNALNFGVLDWTRLEKWKLNQKSDHMKSMDAKNASFSSSSALHVKTMTQRSDLPGSSSPRPSVFDKDGFNHGKRPTTKKVMSSKDTETMPQRSTVRIKERLPASKSLEEITAHNSILGRDSRKESGRKIVSDRGNTSYASTNNVVVLPELDIRRTNHPRKNTSETKSSRVAKHRKGVSTSSIEEETRGRFVKQRELDMNLTPQRCPGKPKSIVLLLPKRFPQSTHSETLKQNEARTTASESLTEACHSLSDSISSDDLNSREFFPDVAQSCPVSSQLGTQNETILTSHVSECNSCKKKEPESEAAKLSFADNLKRLDQEHDNSEARKSRNPSPNRRFSFSFGRMMRSFSFKDSTASVPQLGPSYVSASSGPVTSDASPGFDLSSLEKANTPAKGRSSPLRRLLDPLLKSKSMSFHSSSKTVEPLKATGPVTPGKQQQQFNVRALLQLTVKNGHPLFKFVVENNSKVLAATMKNNTVASGKYGSTRIIKFYSVDEIKKKGISWMGQGNKVKGSDFVYNVVGQMALSDPPFSDWIGDDFEEQTITKECVLSSLESSPADRESTNFVQPRELAAIVFHVPNNRSNYDEALTNRKLKKSITANSSLGEDGGSMTVILPGGIHGLPAKGEPSPLTVRWRSGGSCDCGGWDIGCKLCVLSNHQDNKSSRKSKASSVSDHLQLWAQGEAQENKSVFRMAPFREGIYSVEFDLSISLLQAFSISVAFVNCRAPSGSDPAEANTCVEPCFSRNGTVKGPWIYQTVGGHTKYAPCPPQSPVGRV